jgi:hypothetical protein
MELAKEAQVEYVVITGSTESDVELDALVEIVRHSLRTQFGCKRVGIAIEERITPEHEGCRTSEGVNNHYG